MCELKPGTKRVWAAFGGPADGGTDDGKACVLFRPARQAGDAWTVKAYFDPDPAKDLDDAGALTAKLTKASGKFEVWRKVQVVKYVKKKSAITSVDQGIIQAHFEAAFMNLTFPAAPKSMSDGGEPSYNTVFANEWNATTPSNFNDRSTWIDPAVDQFAAGPEAVTFRDFAGFKAQVIAQRKAALLATGTPPASVDALAATQATTLLNAFGLNSVGQHATECAKNLGRDVANAIAGKYAASDDGITLVHFDKDCNLQPFSSWTWFGFAPDYSFLSRTKAVFVLYGVPPGFGTNSEDQVAHEIGHLLFLVHSPRPLPPNPSAPGGPDATAHDQADYGPCNMSYDHSAPHHFCGFCNLRLRGWDHSTLDKNGASNKKP
jgi:hypothetical protein